MFNIYIDRKNMIIYVFGYLYRYVYMYVIPRNRLSLVYLFYSLDVCEVIMQTEVNMWLVYRKSGQRQFAVFFQKGLNFFDVCGMLYSNLLLP